MDSIDAQQQIGELIFFSMGCTWWGIFEETQKHELVELPIGTVAPVLVTCPHCNCPVLGADKQSWHRAVTARVLRAPPEERPRLMAYILWTQGRCYHDAEEAWHLFSEANLAADGELVAEFTGLAQQGYH